MNLDNGRKVAIIFSVGRTPIRIHTDTSCRNILAIFSVVGVESMTTDSTDGDIVFLPDKWISLHFIVQLLTQP